MSTCDPAALHAHADHLDHVAAVGGYHDEATGRRVILTQTEREERTRDAAILREVAHQMEQEVQQ